VVVVFCSVTIVRTAATTTGSDVHRAGRLPPVVGSEKLSATRSVPPELGSARHLQSSFERKKNQQEVRSSKTQLVPDVQVAERHHGSLVVYRNIIETAFLDLASAAAVLVAKQSTH